jgi:hypothetical protein
MAVPREIDGLLMMIAGLIGNHGSAVHVKTLHEAQRLTVRLRGMSRPLDTELNRLVDACRLLAHKSANDRNWRQTMAVAVANLGRDRQAISKLSEFVNVRRAFEQVNQLSRQLPPHLFTVDGSSRPDRTSRQRRVLEVDRAGNERLMPDNDPIVSGEMVPVESSNVHAVGFDLNQDNPERSTLRVQYKQADQRGGKSRTAGQTYAYHPISHRQFRSMLRAGSKGSWVWDNLRQRGTVAGHKVPYTLIGTRQGYVPRRATMIAGQQWLIRRQKRAILSGGRSMTIQSQLPTRRLGSVRPLSTRPNRLRTA